MSPRGPPLPPAGVLSEIESDLVLSHWQGGLLQTGFVVCYLLSAPAFGYLGDRLPGRKGILSAAVAAWGGCSAVATVMPVRQKQPPPQPISLGWRQPLSDIGRVLGDSIDTTEKKHSMEVSQLC